MVRRKNNILPALVLLRKPLFGLAKRQSPRTVRENPELSLSRITERLRGRRTNWITKTPSMTRTTIMNKSRKCMAFANRCSLPSCTAA